MLRTKATLLWSIFRLSLDNLAVNMLRTMLTLLGIIVGVAAMISVVTIIRGLNEVVASTFSANGSTVFTVSKGPTVITSHEPGLSRQHRMLWETAIPDRPRRMIRKRQSRLNQV